MPVRGLGFRRALRYGKAMSTKRKVLACASCTVEELARAIARPRAAYTALIARGPTWRKRRYRIAKVVAITRDRREAWVKLQDGSHWTTPIADIRKARSPR